MKIYYDVLRILTKGIICETWRCNEKYGLDDERRLFYELRKIRNKNTIGQLGYKIKNILYHPNYIIYDYEFDKNLPVAKNMERFEIEYIPAISRKCKHCHFRHINLDWCMIKNKKITKELHFKCLWWLEKSMLNTLEENDFVYIDKRPKALGGTNKGIYTYKGQ